MSIDSGFVDYRALARASVQTMHPYVGGKPVEEAQRELGLTHMVKLASNENPLGPSKKVTDAVMACLSETNRYPDGNGFYLKQQLAEFYGVEPSMITLGNGSNDVLELIASAYLDQAYSAIYSEHAFVVYHLAVARAGAKAKVSPAKNYSHDLDAMLALVEENTRVIYLANPNNPTGTYFSHASLVNLLDQLPKTILVVLDEAYAEYVEKEDYPDSLTLLKKYNNLIVTKTFSKAYGLSGFRVGFSLSHPDIADMLNRVRQPFNVTLPSLVAAQAALGEQKYLEESVVMNQAGMQQLTEGLQALDIEFIESVGNFICFKPGRNATEVNNDLLRLGVIVRPVANYAMSDFLRVSIGLPAENVEFLKQLKKVLNR